MKSNICKVGFEQDDYQVMLDEVEKAGKYGELDEKQTLRLRLLAEELVGMMKGIIGDYTAKFWVESDGKKYDLIMEATTNIDYTKRQELLKVATSGKNAIYKGFVGRLRQMVEIGLLGVDVPPMMHQTTMNMGVYDMADYSAVWNLQCAIGDMGFTQKKENDVDLEKSIVATLADDVVVGIKGNKARVVIVKDFNK